MPQWFVNALHELLRLCCALCYCIILASCATADGSTASHWPQQRITQQIIPQEGIAHWLAGDTPMLAWIGDPARPNLRLHAVTDASDPRLLPLGITPRRLSAFALADGWTQLLWLDQTLPGETQLIGGTLNAAGEVERGPTEISLTRTVDYAAALTPASAVIVLWATPMRTAQRDRTAIYMQVIDKTGRPLPATKLTDNGAFPAVAFDGRGDLHLLWLHPLTSVSWSIMHTRIDGRADLARLDVADSAATIVGAVSLPPGSLLDSFRVGVDATHLYAVWSVLALGDAPSAERDRAMLNAVTFPLDRPAAVRPLTLAAGETGLRQPTFPSAPTDSLYLAAIATAPNGQRRPIILALTPTGSAVVEGVAGARPIIGRPSISIDTAGKLHLAWLDLDPDGTASLWYATNRPSP